MIKRILSRLDVKNSNLVKGINLEGLRVLGDPSDFAKKYFEEGLDEIIFQDIVASLYKRNQLSEITKTISSEIFIPITVSGGIRSIKDIQEALQMGADRISVNSAAVEDKIFLKKAVKYFGSSTITVTIETLQIDNEYKVFTESGRKNTGLKLLDWIKELNDFGIGELNISSIKHEGTNKGLDLKLFELISNVSDISFLANGGAWEKNDILKLFKNTNAQGIIICSAFHYNYLDEILNKYNNKKNLNNAGSTKFLQNINSSDIKKISIKEVKEFLKKNKIEVR